MRTHPDEARARHLEELLQLTEERFLATFELAPVGIAHLAPDGRWLRVNQRLCSILGYSCEELLELRFQELTHPEDLAADLDQALRTVAGEQASYTIEKRYVRKDGSSVWANVRITLVREKRSEKPLFFVAVVDDVTDRRRAEQALLRHATELRTLLDRLPDVVARFDLEGRHLYVNPAVERATGRAAAEFLGRTNRELGMVEHLAEQWEEAQRAAIRSDEVQELHFVFPSPDGERRFWSFLVPEHDEEGRIVGLLSVARDVTGAGVPHLPPDGIVLPPALGEGEAAFRALFQHAAVGIAEVGTDGRCLRANDRFCDIVGYPPDELRGVSFHQVTHPDDLAADALQVERMLAGEIDSYSMEKRYVGKDGRTTWAELTVSLVRDAAGRPWRFVAVVEDLRGRKLAESRLAESEARFRFLAEMIPHLVWSARADGGLDYFNRRWLEYTGQTRDEAHASRWGGVLHPEDREHTLGSWRNSLRTVEPLSVECRLRRHDGEYRWHLWLALPLRDGSGAVERWFGTCTDIQLQKDAEQARRESEERLQAALDASATGTFRWSIRSGALDWDAALDRLFGLPSSDTPRTVEGFLARVHPGDRPRVVEAVARCASHGVDFHEEFRVVWPDGSVRWLLDKGRTYLDAEGRPLYMTGACVDITERKAVEAEREKLLAAAQAANRFKSEFLANMSHEIRTPINAVLGYADLLELGIGGSLEAGQLERVRRIQGSGRHLLALVNDVLDLAKVEAGEMHVLREEVAVHRVALDALEITDSLLAKRGVVLFDETGGCADGRVWGDPGRIRQILVNLLSNACKFSEPGGSIHVRCRAQPGTPQGVDSTWPGPWVALEVEDGGIGISPEMQELIFAPFVQDVGGRDRGGGTGLGLSISRMLASMMEGALTVRSTPGEGACFTLWLPASTSR
ncbi:MAG: PAS domain S-box protein [Longimicrobiaceae bacterium]